MVQSRKSLRAYPARRGSRMAALAIAAALAASSAQADTSFWLAGSGEWTTAANWSGAVPNAPGDLAIFQFGQAPPVVSVGAPVSVGGIVMDGAAAYTFKGTTALTFNSLLGPATLVLTPNVGAFSTIFNVPVMLASDLVITNQSAAPLAFDSPLSGSGNLTLNGSGEVRLNAGNNAWTPATITVNSGLLSSVLGSINAFGNPTSGTITVKSGASLDVTRINLTGTASQFLKTLVLSGQGTAASGGAVVYNATTNTLAGPIVLDNGATFSGTSASALLNIGNASGPSPAAALTGTGPLIKSGPGTLRLNIQAAHSGGTRINAGTFIVAPTGSLVGTGDVTVNSGGRLVLTRGAGNSAASAAVSPGAVLLNGGTASIAADFSVATLFSPLTTSGLISIDVPGFTAGGTNLVDLSSFGSGALVRLTAAAGITVPSSMTFLPNASTHILHLGGGAGLMTFAGVIADAGATPTQVDIRGQQIILSGTSSYMGQSILSEGANVTLLSSTGLGSEAAGTLLQPGATLLISVPTAEPFTVNGGALNISSATSGDIFVKAGTLTLAAAGTSNVSVAGGTASVNVPWSSPISISSGTLTIGSASTAPLSVSGGTVIYAVGGNQPMTITGGTVTISSPSTGAITVAGGLLRQVGTGSFFAQSVTLAGGRLGLVSNLSFAMLNPASSLGAITLDGAIAYNGGGTNLIDFSALASGNTISLTTSINGASVAATAILKPEPTSSTLRLGGGTAAGTLTVAAAIRDYNGIATHVHILPGTPTIALSSAASTYTGLTTVDGPLLITHGSALGFGDATDASATVINPGGRVAASVLVPLEKFIINGGSLTGLVGGPVRVDGPGMLAGTFSGPLQVNAPGTLTGTYSGVISGSSSFYLGTATLQATNNFSSTLVLLAGNVASINNPAALGAGDGTDATATVLGTGAHLTSPVPITLENEKLISDGGTVSLNSNGPVLLNSGTTKLRGLFAGPISGPGAVSVSTALTLSGANDYAGQTLVPAGSTLTLAPGSSLGNEEGSTFIQNGTLVLNAPSAEPIQMAGGNFNIGSVAHTGTFSAAGGTITGAPGSSLAAPLQISSGTLTVTGATSALGGTSGPGALTVGVHNGFNSSTVTLAGPLAHTGPTTFEGGAITIDGNAAFSGNVSAEYVRLILNGSASFNALTFSGTGGVFGSYLTSNGYTVVNELQNNGGSLRFNAPVAINRFAGGSGNATFVAGGTFTSINTGGLVFLNGPSVINSGILVGVVANAPLTLNRGLSGFQNLTLNATNVQNGTWNLFKPNPIALFGTVVVTANNTVDRLTIDFNRLQIQNGATLTVLHPEVVMRSGELLGNLAGVTSLRKLSNDVGVFNPGPSFEGTVSLEGGTLSMNTSSGGPIFIGRSAMLFIFNSAQAINLDNAVTFDGVAALRGGTLTGPITLGAQGSSVEGNFSGPISGGDLIVAGPSVFQSAASTYTGMTRVLSTMDVRNSGRLDTTSGVTLYPGGALRLTGTGALNQLADHIPIIGSGGTLLLSRGFAAGITVAETVGTFSAVRGNSTIGVGTGQNIGPFADGTNLTITTLERSPGATVHFYQNFGDSVPPPGTTGSITLGAAPLLQNGLIGAWATASIRPGPVNLFEPPHFATYTSAGVVPLDTYQSNINGALSSENVNVLSNVTLADSGTIHSLRVIAATLNLGGRTLTLLSGGLIVYPTHLGGPTPAVVQNGTIVASGNELVIHGQGTIGATLANSADGPTAITIDAASITLNGPITASGPIFLSGGVSFGAAQALPTTQQIHLARSEISFPFTASGSVTLGPITTAASPHDFQTGSTGNGIYAPQVGINAASYTFDGGVGIYASLVGTGPMAVNAPVAFYYQHGNLNNYAGNITINAGGRFRLVFLTPNTLSVGSGTITVNPGGELYLQQAVTGNLRLNGGTLLGTLSAPIASTVASFSGTLQIPASSTIANIVVGPPVALGPGVTLTLADAGVPAVTGTGAIAVPEYTYAYTNNVNGPSLNVAGRLQIRPSGTAGGVTAVSALAIAGAVNAWTGTLDLTNNALVVQSATPAEKAARMADLVNQVASGRRDGAWDGPGVTSSTLAANATAGSLATTLAVFDNAVLNLTTLRGQPVDANALLVVQAHVADANFDNKVNAFDLNQLASHWQQAAGATTFEGDFDGDGKVDAFDLNLLAAYWQFGGGGSVEAPFAAALAEFPVFAGISSPFVPEPGTLAMFAAGAGALLGRRRRRQTPC